MIIEIQVLSNEENVISNDGNDPFIIFHFNC